MITIVCGNHNYKNVTFPERRFISRYRAILEQISAAVVLLEVAMEMKGTSNNRE